jgi:hypothetical protein
MQLAPINPDPAPMHAPPTYSSEPDTDSLGVTPQLFVERFPLDSSGTPIPSSHQGSSSYHSSQDLFAASDWAPFHSQCDWEVARWAKMRGSTSSAMEDLLAIPEARVRYLAIIVMLTDFQRLSINSDCHIALQKSSIISSTMFCLGALGFSAVNLSLEVRLWSYIFGTY